MIDYHFLITFLTISIMIIMIKYILIYIILNSQEYLALILTIFDAKIMIILIKYFF